MCEGQVSLLLCQHPNLLRLGLFWQEVLHTVLAVCTKGVRRLHFAAFKGCSKPLLLITDRKRDNQDGIEFREINESHVGTSNWLKSHIYQIYLSLHTYQN